jgi:DNA-binding PadR family transcriptional regulator
MAKTETTPTEVLMLGLLYAKPQHGYELNRLIEDRGVRQWANVGFSSIYYLLEKLEARGLVKSNGVKSKAKKTFSITAAGKKVCKSRTSELIKIRIPNKNPFMTGLANSFALSDSALMTLLESRLSELKAQLSLVKREWENQKPVPKQADYLFGFTINEISSEISWIKSVLKEQETDA